MAKKASLHVETRRKLYLHVARGAITGNSIDLNVGDALKIRDNDTLTLSNGGDAEVIVFDLPQYLSAARNQELTRCLALPSRSHCWTDR